MYKIVITRTELEKKIKPKQWETVSQRLITDEDLKPSAYGSRSELKEKLLSGEAVIFDERGYTPEIEEIVTVDREILKQEVEELDLAAVIRAINKL